MWANEEFDNIIYKALQNGNNQNNERKNMFYLLLRFLKHLATLDVRGGNDEKLFGGDHENAVQTVTDSTTIP